MQKILSFPYSDPYLYQAKQVETADYSFQFLSVAQFYFSSSRSFKYQHVERNL